MVAGLPGTGIGGLFYLALVLWMPLRELTLLLRGRSSLARWRSIAGLWTLVAAMVAMIVIQAWAIALACDWLVEHAPAHSTWQEVGLMADQSWSVSFALVPVYILAGVLAAMHLLRMCCRLEPKARLALRRAGRLSQRRSRRHDAGQPLVVLGDAKAA
jgi:hypothetical protein